jgi:hypothetical protein
MNLRSALLDSSSGQLSRIAAAWKLTVEAGTLRRELVELLSDRIAAATADPSTWQGLVEIDRAVFRLIVQAGGRHEAELLTRRLGRAVGTSVGGDEAALRIERSVADLIERGLLFRVFDADEQRRGVYVIAPDEVVSGAREHLGDGPGPGPAASAALPEQVAYRELAVDLFVLASALRREAWGAASRGLAGRPAQSVGQILSRLRGLPADGPGDPGRRWRFLLWLAQRAGWIGRDAWPTPDEVGIERLMSDPSGLPALALGAGPVVDQGGSRGEVSGRSDARQRQADALQLLSELTEGRWWSLNELASWLARELTNDTEATVSVRGRSERGRLEEQLRRWLVGRWFWLGLVSWGWDGSGWSLVAPTDALRSLATGRRPAASPRPVACQVSDRLRLFAPSGADLALLYRAERYLAFAGGDPGERRYGLTPASFDRGVRLGGDADELRSLLGRLIDGPIPTAWLEAIDTWASGSSRLTLASRLLLSSDTEQTLAEALATTSARNAVTEALSPRHVLIAGERVAGLLTDLAQAGLPVEIDPGVRAEPANPGRAAALSGSVAETAWVALEVLRRLAPDVVAEQRDLQTARSRLDAVLAARVLEALDRRATTIVAVIANRRRPRTRGRVV